MIDLIQFRNKANPLLEYTQRVWEKTEGYHCASRAYLEVPTWAAIVMGKLQEMSDFRCLEEPVKLPDSVKSVIGSVLDVNSKAWKELIRLNPEVSFYLGGYVNPSTFIELEDYNLIWLDKPDDLGKHFDWDNTRGPSYHFWAGVPCIPRLALSYGCLYKCSFCSIPRTLTERFELEIMADVKSFKPLSFELLYIDDKTFGQAKNWKLIEKVYNTVKAYNPKFKGFIVQSTAIDALKHLHLWALHYHVKYLEIGVESMDPKTLKAWNKPHTPYMVRKLCLALKAYPSVKLIPNIIFGIPGDDRGPHDYTLTLGFLKAIRPLTAFVNPYVLCAYHDSHGKPQLNSDSDSNENTLDKSWLTEAEKVRVGNIIEEALALY